MASARLRCWERSFWHCTTVLVGRCVMRTALSVVFTLWPPEPVDREYPVHLTTGRILAHYQSGAQTRRVAALASAATGPFVELHPALAGQLGVADGDLLRVVSRRGAAVAPARVTRAIRADTVFMPFHWGGEGSANLVTNPVLDPVSRMPAFKACAVRVERAAQPGEGGQR